MKIELQGCISERDYIVAQWVHLKPRPFFAVLGTLLVLLMLTVLVFSFVKEPAFHGHGKWYLLAFLLYLVFSSTFWLPYKAKRTFRQHRALQAEQKWQITDQGLKFESERGTCAIPWSDFVKWKHGHGVFILYPTDRMFYLLPCRLFASGNEMEQFKAFLQRTVAA